MIDMSEKKYSHVMLIGVDGAGGYFKVANTPNFDRIFANGAVTFDALASNPTISAECWGAMILGIGPEVHKLTNENIEDHSYPLDSKFPSVFRRVREKYPDAAIGSFCNWDSINKGLIEDGMNVDLGHDRDEKMTPMICDYIKAKKPTFLFVQFDSVDGAGHNEGYGSEKYLTRISEIDELLGDIYAAVEEAGIADDTLFMVIADHGGEGWSHGGWTDTEKYVTFAATGKGVEKGTIPEMNIRDSAAIVLYALGIDQPEFEEDGWTAQIPDGIWPETDGKYRDISHLTGAEPRISRTQHHSEPV